MAGSMPFGYRVCCCYIRMNPYKPDQTPAHARTPNTREEENIHASNKTSRKVRVRVLRAANIQTYRDMLSYINVPRS